MTIREDTEQILQRCRSLGFSSAGVARAEAIGYHRELIEWLESNKHGEMSWLEKYFSQRVDPRKMLVGCRSVIAVTDWYARWKGAVEEDEIPKRHGRIAKYAQGDDYHTSMKKRLISLCDELQAEYPEARFRAAVDTAPVMEREHAARAALGYVGKHTLLIEPGVGSYFFVGEILTTLELEPSEGRIEDHCGTCTRCIDACPTKAITPYSVDATKCISYLTIEHRSLIDEKYYEAMGDWIFGCDICQEVCPHNGETEATRNVQINPAHATKRTGFDLLEVLGWNEEDRRKAFARSAMKRAKLDMMKRNALIAAGNFLKEHDDAELEARVAVIAADHAEDGLIRTTAERVIERLVVRRANDESDNHPN